MGLTSRYQSYRFANPSIGNRICAAAKRKEKPVRPHWNRGTLVRELCMTCRHLRSGPALLLLLCLAMGAFLAKAQTSAGLSAVCAYQTGAGASGVVTPG